MTTNKLSDISVSVNTSPGQVKNDKKSGDAKEDFMSLMAGNVAAMPVANVDAGQKPDFKDFSSNSDSFEMRVDSSSYSNSNRIDKMENMDNPYAISEENLQDIKDEIESYVSEIKDVIKEEMDVSVEDIEIALETLGLDYVDLANPKNLAALLNQLNGSEDSVNLLLDTSVKDVIDQVGVLTENLLQETETDIEGIQIFANMELPKEMPQEIAQMPEADAQVVPVMETTEAVPVEIETREAETPEMVSEKEGAPLLADRPREDRESVETETTEDTDNEAVTTLKNMVTTASDDNKNHSMNQGGNSNHQSQTAPQTTTVVNDNVIVNANAPAADFSEAIADVDTNVEVPVYTNVNTADVIEQLVTSARVNITEQVRSMELQLNPHNLGRMIMQVSESEGQITAKFITQNEHVREALEGAIANLVERLSEAGVKVDAVEVSVGTHEFEENLEEQFANQAREDLNQSDENRENNQNRRGGINLADDEYMAGAELTEEEQLEASIMRTYGNTVNFRA